MFALGALVAAERRSRRVARSLGLAPSRRRSALPVAAALAAVGAFVALAAAQPVVSGVRDKKARTDAEVIVVVDITRSMLAAPSATAPTRFARAKAAATTLRAALAEVPVGVTSLTDRLLPHLFPSASVNTFAATVDRALGIERPPPDRSRRGVATAFAALGILGTQNYFGEAIRKRVVVVLTDGETVPFDAPTVAARLERARITPVFVHFWSPDERIHGRGAASDRYRAEPGTDTRLGEIARALGGSAHDEDDLGDAVQAVRRALGEGPVGSYDAELQTRTLSAWVLPLALVPLAFVLWRRNL